MDQAGLWGPCLVRFGRRVVVKRENYGLELALTV